MNMIGMSISNLLSPLLSNQPIHPRRRKTEARINSFDNYTASIEGEDGESLDIHFIALQSTKPKAVPIVLLHGWPGSPLEFLGLLDLARNKYKQPSDLPYTFIVPSLPGYAFSSGPSSKSESTCETMAYVVDKLMTGLGFGGSGYVAQGGDIGSFVARILGAGYESCKAVHCECL
jgi:pimeloyl-ACP methyl ester carboxylesterase